MSFYWCKVNYRRWFDINGPRAEVEVTQKYETKTPQIFPKEETRRNDSFGTRAGALNRLLLVTYIAGSCGRPGVTAADLCAVTKQQEK
jgi:hypothetical protein